MTLGVKANQGYESTSLEEIMKGCCFLVKGMERRGYSQTFQKVECLLGYNEWSRMDSVFLAQVTDEFTSVRNMCVGTLLGYT